MDPQLKQFFENNGLSGNEGISITTTGQEGEKPIKQYCKLHELFAKFETFKEEAKKEATG